MDWLILQVCRLIVVRFFVNRGISCSDIDFVILQYVQYWNIERALFRVQYERDGFYCTLRFSIFYLLFEKNWRTK